MNAIELLDIINSGETSKVQFKRELDNQDKVAAEMIAFSNLKGGMMLFGVEDKTGAILGLSYELLQSISNKIGTIANELVKPTIYITTEVVPVDISDSEKKHVLIVYINEGVSKPYKDKNGAIWIKQGADKRRVTDNTEIMRLFQQSGNLLADEMGVYGTSIDDINQEAFADYFKKEFRQSYEEKGLTFEKALKAKRILRNSQLSLAGLLFFGKDPQSIKPAFTIKAVSFIGNEISGTQYRSKPADFRGTIPQLFDEAMGFLKTNLKYLQGDKEFNSTGVLEISEIALIELVQNSLVHRDYFKNSPIRILIFDDRVEIISPGKLPNSLTVDDIKFGNPVIRNNQLVAFSSHTMPFSGLGSGIKRAIAEQPDIELINDTEGEQFIVKIPRPEQD